MLTSTPDATMDRARQVRDASLLLVDKPVGVTSHDVVSAARRTLGERRIGHHGTLDPFATGLLVLLVGRATRLAPWLDGEPKVYQATFILGAETDTHDLTGRVVREAPLPDSTAVDSAVQSLNGSIMQLPPSYSAKKVGGVKAYEAARRGQELALEPVPVTVYKWEIESRRESELVARITCSGGTYIRALARDLGVLSGSAAHLAALRRLSAGPMHVEQAVSLAELRDGHAPLTSPLAAMNSLRRVELSVQETVDVAHGRSIAAASREEQDGVNAARGDGGAASAARAALVTPEGALAAVAELHNERWLPRVVVLGPGGSAIA